MSLTERFLKDFDELPKEKKKEDIDFIEFFKMKDRNQLGTFMDIIIKENHQALKELSQ